MAAKRKKASKKKTSKKRSARSLSATDRNSFKESLLQKRREIFQNVFEIEGETLKKSRLDATGDLSSMPIHMADIGTDNYEQEFALHLMDLRGNGPAHTESAAESPALGAILRRVCADGRRGSRQRTALALRRPSSVEISRNLDMEPHEQAKPAPSRSQHRLRCPTCRRPFLTRVVGTSRQPESFPFCCERCRLIDLGAWLEAEYRIPSRLDDDPEAPPVEAFADPEAPP